MYVPYGKKDWNQVSSPKWRAHNRHLTTSTAVIARSNAKYQGARDQRIKPKFPRNFSFPCYKEGEEGMDRGTLNAITMSKKTRESLTEKKFQWAREK